MEGLSERGGARPAQGAFLASAHGSVSNAPADKEPHRAANRWAAIDRPELTAACIDSSVHLKTRRHTDENRLGPPSPTGLTLSGGRHDHTCFNGRTTPGCRRAGPPFSSLVRIDVDAQSHAGHRRANNEDHFLVTRLGRTLQTLITSLPAGDVPERTEEVNYVMVVADGMGGHAAGEVASRMAISALVSLALDVPDWIFRVDEEHAPEIERRSRKRVQEVGAMLVERGRRDPALRGMGTTLTAARSLGRDLMITHVGDSRAYLLRAGGLHRLTRDHTYAQLLVDTGQLAPGDVAASRHRHVLTNALGGSSRTCTSTPIGCSSRTAIACCSAATA